MNESSPPPTVRSTSMPHHHRHARAAIVNTAASMMYHRGVAATSVGDVFHASGAEARELHRHFRDKTELVHAVIDRELAVVLDGQDAADAITSWDGLDTRCRAWWAHNRPRMARSRVPSEPWRRN